MDNPYQLTASHGVTHVFTNEKNLHLFAEWLQARGEANPTLRRLTDNAIWDFESSTWRLA